MATSTKPSNMENYFKHATNSEAIDRKMAIGWNDASTSKAAGQAFREITPNNVESILQDKLQEAVNQNKALEAQTTNARANMAIPPGFFLFL